MAPIEGMNRMITGILSYIEKGLIVALLVALVVVATALSPIAKGVLALASITYRGTKKLIQKSSTSANDSLRKREKKHSGYENYFGGSMDQG